MPCDTSAQTFSLKTIRPSFSGSRPAIQRRIVVFAAPEGTKRTVTRDAESTLREARIFAPLLKVLTMFAVSKFDGCALPGLQSLRSCAFQKFLGGKQRVERITAGDRF